MDISSQFPTFKNWYFLEVFPWDHIPENLINAIKIDTGTFKTKNTWYGMDTYIWKKDSKPFVKWFINSSTKEGLIYYVSFLSKLYWNQISFSRTIQKLPEKFEKTRNIGSIKQTKAFPTKSAGSVWGSDFEWSSSFISSVISEGLPYIDNGNGIIKVSFSFTDSYWWYSKLIEILLTERRKYGMTPEEIILFNEQEKKKPFNRFLFQWNVSSSKVASGFNKTIEQILRGYASEENSYTILPSKERHYPGNRLIEPEKLLAYWLISPRGSQYGKIQKIPILPIPSSAYTDGFII